MLIIRNLRIVYYNALVTPLHRLPFFLAKTAFVKGCKAKAAQNAITVKALINAMPAGIFITLIDVQSIYGVGLSQASNILSDTKKILGKKRITVEEFVSAQQLPLDEVKRQITPPAKKTAHI